MSSYEGNSGGPRDPNTPCGYCLARCYCGDCPQYEAQRNPVAIAAELRDRGIRRVDNNTDPGWKAQVDQAITMLAASGQPFTADTVRELGMPEPASPQAWGARFMSAARAGHIRRIGYQPSKRASVHAHPVAVWEGAA